MNIKIKKIQICTIFLAFLISGCSPKTFQSYSQEDDLSKKGVVVIRTLGDNAVTFKKLDKNYNNQQSNDDYYYVETKSIAGIFLDDSYEKCFYTLEPGIYYIVYGAGADYRYKYNTTLPGITPEGTIVYGAFEVKAGEVLYIGTINFDWSKNDPESFVYVTGDLQKAKLDLLGSESKHKNLLAKMKYGNLYKYGSIIYADKNGNFKIR